MNTPQLKIFIKFKIKNDFVVKTFCVSRLYKKSKYYKNTVSFYSYFMFKFGQNYTLSNEE